MPTTPDATRTTGRFIHAASETCADMWYASGFAAPDPFLWFAVPGLTAVVIGPLELGRARKEARPGLTVLSEREFRRDFHLPDDAGSGPRDMLAAISRIAGITGWEAPASMPLGLARELEAAGLSVQPVACFFPERARKNPAEVAEIEHGVRLAEAGLAWALEILRDAEIGAHDCLLWHGQPVTSELLRGEIAATIARLGGAAGHTIAAVGRQAADPHLVGNGPVHAYEPIVLDIFPRVERSGYFGDLTRTVVKGRAPEGIQRAYAAVCEAQRRACREVRAGVPGSAVHTAAARALEAAGFSTDLKADPPHGFIHGLGHGLGLEIHELPRLNAKAEALLEAGQVITVEPGLYDPAWGGIRLEDVIVVEEGGYRNLTRAPLMLEIPLT